MKVETTSEAYEGLEFVRDCDKNPGHEQFYSVKDLNEDFLPEECRDKEWVSFIRENSKRVVRLTVYKNDGTRMFGSGCVFKDIHSDDLYIKTNHHVIGTPGEVKKCIIEFFYDLKDKKEVETSYGLNLNSCYCDVHKDLCKFRFAPVPPKIAQLMSDRILVPSKTDLKHIIVIAHPHGGPKTITIGKYLGDKRRNHGIHGVNTHIHTARTCPGSSGGVVINTSCRQGLLDWRYGHNYTHCDGERLSSYKEMVSETGNINLSVLW